MEQELFILSDTLMLLNNEKKGTTIEDISKLMNTSPRMVMSVYLGNTDEVLVQLHKRIPKKLKVVK